MKKLTKQILLATTLLVAFLSCDSDDDATASIVEIEVFGDTFLRTSYVIENPIDTNNDGIFSYDLMEEDNCGGHSLVFVSPESISDPTFFLTGFKINTDNNGNNTQDVACVIVDGLGLKYKINGNAIDFFFNEELQFTGEFSNNGNTITFSWPNEILYILRLEDSYNDILTEDGTIIDYEGGAIVTYERQ